MPWTAVGRGTCTLLPAYADLGTSTFSRRTSSLFGRWTSTILFTKNVREVENSIREDLNGIRMEGHWRDLIERLDHVLGQLDQREASPFVHRAKARYEKLKDVLLEVGKR
jgi:hypothetical protein